MKRLHDSVSGRFIAVKIITPDQRAAARNETRAVRARDALLSAGAHHATPASVHPTCPRLRS